MRRALYALPLLALLLGLSLSASAGTVIPTADGGATVATYQGGACLSCGVYNEDRVIDANLASYATLQVPAGVEGFVGLGVTFGETLRGGHRAGFVLSNALGSVDADVLDAITLQTFAGGQLRESARGRDGLSVEVLPGGDSRVRFKTTRAFDEVRLFVHGRVDVATHIRAHYALASIANGTGGALIPLASEGATVRSGTAGFCFGCGVDDEAAVIADDLAQSATLRLTAGVMAEVWLEVGYPDVMAGGTKTGFILFDVPGLANDELLDGLTLTTYLGGVAQESKTGTSDIELLPDEEEKVNIAFRPVRPFDAVRVSVSGLIGAEVELRVQNAYSIPGGSAKTTPEAPRPASGALSAPAPNPSASAASVALHVTESQHVRVRLLDVRGREVASLLDRRVEQSEAVDVPVDVRALPSGVYVIAAVGETFAESRRLSVVR